MDLTGVIFAAIAIAWLAYLVPQMLRSRDHEQLRDDADADQFADSMRVIARGTAQLVDHDGAPLRQVEVSTPLTRRAAIRDLQRVEALAASRRRRVLVVLMAVVTATLVAGVLHLVPWWAMAIPGGLVIAFVVVARFSVTVMKRSLDQRYHDIVGSADEATVFLQRVNEADAEPSVGIPLKSPVRATNALWDPLPITMPTYVSKPLAPRTVRTIDLAGPSVTSSGRQSLPVTADAPRPESVEQPDATVAPVSAQAVESDAEAERRAG